MNSALSVINKLGGPTKTAALAEVNASTVYRWTQPQPHGTGGIIPMRYWDTLIARAAQKGIALKRADFIDQTGEAA